MTHLTLFCQTRLPRHPRFPLPLLFFPSPSFPSLSIPHSPVVSPHFHLTLLSLHSSFFLGSLTSRAAAYLFGCIILSSLFLGIGAPLFQAVDLFFIHHCPPGDPTWSHCFKYYLDTDTSHHCTSSHEIVLNSRYVHPNEYLSPFGSLIVVSNSTCPTWNFLFLLPTTTTTKFPPNPSVFISVENNSIFFLRSKTIEICFFLFHSAFVHQQMKSALLLKYTALLLLHYCCLNQTTSISHYTNAKSLQLVCLLPDHFFSR